jgi:2'-5' RNA ligase
VVRLFVALRPPDDVLDIVAGLRRRERDGVRWTTREQWHVTLRFLGEVADPQPVATALDDAVLNGCTAVVGPQVTALGREVVIVPVAGVEDLAAVVVAATRDVGKPPATRPFRGHLTLARARHGSVRDLVGEPVEARFRVDAVRLVRSHLGRDGARYEDLHVRHLR